MAADKKFEVSKAKLVVVEGRDEVSLFGALLNHLGISDVDLIDLGRSKLGAKLKGLVDGPNFPQIVKSFGLVLDAEEDPNGTKSLIKGALKEAGLPIPDAPSVPSDGPPRVAFMIMPPNDEAGALESVLLAAINVEDKAVFGCVEQYIACLEQLGVTYNTAAREAKAKIHAYLASKPKDPDKRVGEGAQAGYWDWNNQAFAPVVQFLKSL